MLLWAATSVAQSVGSTTAMIDSSRAAVPNVALTVRGKILASVLGDKFEGTYIYSQADLDHWREEVRVADFSEVRVANSPKLLVQRSTPGESPIIAMMFDAIHREVFLHGKAEEQLKSVKQRADNGRKSVCARLSIKEHGSRELCFDVNTNDLLSYESRGQIFRYEYSANGARVPSVITATEDKNNWIQLTLEMPLMASPAPDLNLPAAAQPLGWCSEMMDETIARRVTPRYPETARQNKIQGTTLLSAVIEPDGSVTINGVVRSAGKELDAASIEGVRQWQYHPATCGGRPVRKEVIITTNFQLY
jgi:TonB family protein